MKCCAAPGGLYLLGAAWNKKEVTFVDTPEITIREVLDLVGATTKGRISGKGEVEMLCPLYTAKPHYLEVNLERGFRCWKMCSGCPVEGRGGAVNLYRLFHPEISSFSEAVKAIREKKPGCLCTATKGKPHPTIQPPRDLRAVAKERDKTYRALMSLLTLSDKHKENLRKRGLDEKAISQFRSIPACGLVTIPQLLQKEGCQLEGVPLLGKVQGTWTLCTKRGATGFYIPYYDENGLISQLQIRYDVTADSDKDFRYRWASSAGYKEGCGAMNIPFWGSAPYSGGKVYLTEGGLKAIVANNISGRYFVAIPGVTCFDAVRQIFSRFKGKTIVDCFDMDGKIRPDEKIITEDERHIRVANKQGEVRVINASVYNALQRIRKISQEFDVTIEDCFWDDEKGIDDFLLAERIRGNLNAAQDAANDEEFLDDSTVNCSVPIIPPIPIGKRNDKPQEQFSHTPIIPVIPTGMSNGKEAAAVHIVPYMSVGKG